MDHPQRKGKIRGVNEKLWDKNAKKEVWDRDSCFAAGHVSLRAGKVWGRDLNNVKRFTHHYVIKDMWGQDLDSV